MSPLATRGSKPFLSLNQATFRLGDRLVFEQTNWRIHRGEQWGIIGPNGSGKSILADGLRGRLPLVKGELRYHFRPPPNLSHEEAIGQVAFEDRKTELDGAVVQSRWTSFEEETALTVSHFLSYQRVMEVNPFEVGARHGIARQHFERRLRRALELFQIRGFLPRRLLSLSNGERQRVQLARALAQPLRLLILDEPYLGAGSSHALLFPSCARTVARNESPGAPYHDPRRGSAPAYFPPPLGKRMQSDRCWTKAGDSCPLGSSPGRSLAGPGTVCGRATAY